MKTLASNVALKIQNTGKRMSDKKRIIKLFESKFSLTILDIMNELNLPINTVSARISDIYDMGLLKEFGGSRGGYTIYYFEHDLINQKKIRHNRG